MAGQIAHLAEGTGQDLLNAGILGTAFLMLAWHVISAMASQLVRVLIQAGVLPSLVSPIWNTSAIVSMDSAAGAILHALVGHDARPAGMQMVFYASGVIVILIGMRVMRSPQRTRVTARAARQSCQLQLSWLFLAWLLRAD